MGSGKYNLDDSTIWSCLAAHAAVLCSDGIVRRALPHKLSGVFECREIADEPIVAAAPRCWRVAHSRCNELPEALLSSHGYQLLSRSEEAGPDLFARQKQSLFVFFQGHPEWPRRARSRYRRDVGRFLACERDDYPEIPLGYFDEAAMAALYSLRKRALRRRTPELLASYPTAALGRPARAPDKVAVGIYRNRLSFIAAAMQQARAQGRIPNPKRSPEPPT